MSYNRGGLATRFRERERERKRGRATLQQSHRKHGLKFEFKHCIR